MADKTAKIVRFHATGGPEVLKVEEEPVPEPGRGDSSSEREGDWIEQGRGDVPPGQISGDTDAAIEAWL